MKNTFTKLALSTKTDILITTLIFFGKKTWPNINFHWTHIDLRLSGSQVWFAPAISRIIKTHRKQLLIWSVINSVKNLAQIYRCSTMLLFKLTMPSTTAVQIGETSLQEYAIKVLAQTQTSMMAGEAEADHVRLLCKKTSEPSPVRSLKPTGAK